MKRSRQFFVLARFFSLVVIISFLLPLSARADVAPPGQPPGSNIMPGAATTQVRMMAETVTLTVLSKPAAAYLGQAKTEARFTMRNLGTATEQMEARFPLWFWTATDPDFNPNAPEITAIQILVNGKVVPTHRIDDSYPWAAFDVSFPPGQDVDIEVDYTTNGYGLDPVFALRYILETGAGWNGTIGSADIIVRLPYAASEQNVLLSDDTGLPQTTTGAQIAGTEVRWHFADFEPTADDNIMLSLVTTAAWQKVLDWRAQTQKTPNDGEAWGQLGKAIKEVVRGKHGEIRDDTGAGTLYKEAVAAYEKSVTLLPKDPLWHYGYADLLLAHAAYSSATQSGDYSELAHGIDQLRQSLALDPNNQNAKDTASWINGLFPWALSPNDNNTYDYSILTATPESPTDTETPLAEVSATPESVLPTATEAATLPAAASTSPPNKPSAGLPLCGGGALLLPLLAGLLWLFSKRHEDMTYP